MRHRLLRESPGRTRHRPHASPRTALSQAASSGRAGAGGAFWERGLALGRHVSCAGYSGPRRGAHARTVSCVLVRLGACGGLRWPEPVQEMERPPPRVSFDATAYSSESADEAGQPRRQSVASLGSCGACGGRTYSR